MRRPGSKGGVSMDEKLLTTGNAGGGADAALFARPGLRPMAGEEPMRVVAE